MIFIVLVANKQKLLHLVALIKFARSALPHIVFLNLELAKCLAVMVG